MSTDYTEAKLLKRGPAWKSFISGFEARKEEALTQIKQVDVLKGTSYEGRVGFMLENVLSAEECEFLIQETEALGYENMTEYASRYRSNTRLFVTYQALADAIYERIRGFCPETMSPYEENDHWQINSLNERFRFCRYTEGQHFSPHSDAQFCASASKHSFLTFMIYMNAVPDEFGGSTNFLNRKTGKVESRVNPSQGMVLIFEHPLYHEGQMLTGGLKYLMRSDVMYTHNA